MSQWPKDLRIYEIYPQGKTSFVEYDDDGTTEAYREGYSTVTRISSEQEGDKVTVIIEPTEGMYDGMVKERVTELRINVTQAPKSLVARIGKKSVKLQAVSSREKLYAGKRRHLKQVFHCYDVFIHGASLP